MDTNEQQSPYRKSHYHGIVVSGWHWQPFKTPDRFCVDMRNRHAFRGSAKPDILTPAFYFNPFPKKATLLMNGETHSNANRLDYSVVNSYWKKAAPSIMGPYMMDGFGFPASAGRFRFHAESVIVQQLIRNAKVDTAGAVLDLGSGVGYWAEYFALKFKKVVAVEASAPLYESMVQRCSSYDNFTPIQDDVLSFEPEGRFSLIFLGGLLMCLNENDVIALLQKLKSLLTPGGIILCRESTVRNGTVTREGEYQAVYRSVPTYLSLFNRCGLTVAQTCLNVPYILMQMGCELIKAWQANVPKNLQIIPAVGHLAYWGLRLGNPWITRIPSAMGIDFPELTNHFFLVRPSSQPLSSGKTSLPLVRGKEIWREACFKKALD